MSRPQGSLIVVSPGNRSVPEDLVLPPSSSKNSVPCASFTPPIQPQPRGTPPSGGHNSSLNYSPTRSGHYLPITLPPILGTVHDPKFANASISTSTCSGSTILANGGGTSTGNSFSCSVDSLGPPGGRTPPPKSPKSGRTVSFNASAIIVETETEFDAGPISPSKRNGSLTVKPDFGALEAAEHEAPKAATVVSLLDHVLVLNTAGIPLGGASVSATFHHAPPEEPSQQQNPVGKLDLRGFAIQHFKKGALLSGATFLYLAENGPISQDSVYKHAKQCGAVSSRSQFDTLWVENENNSLAWSTGLEKLVDYDFYLAAELFRRHLIDCDRELAFLLTTRSCLLPWITFYAATKLEMGPHVVGYFWLHSEDLEFCRARQDGSLPLAQMETLALGELSNHSHSCCCVRCARVIAISTLTKHQQECQEGPPLEFDGEETDVRIVGFLPPKSSTPPSSLLGQIGRTPRPANQPLSNDELTKIINTHFAALTTPFVGVFAESHEETLWPDVNSHIRIVRLLHGGAAVRAGLRPGDIVVNMGLSDVSTKEDVYAACKPGWTAYRSGVVFSVVRAGQNLTFPFKTSCLVSTKNLERLKKAKTEGLQSLTAKDIQMLSRLKFPDERVFQMIESKRSPSKKFDIFFF